MKNSTSCIGKLIHVIASQNQLGENALWHPQQRAIYWIDIMAGDIHKYTVDDQAHQQYHLPYRIGSFAFLAHQDTYQVIVAFEQGFALYHLETHAITWLSQPEVTQLGNRFNDGRTDRGGHFWAGTMVETRHTPQQQGSLYRIDQYGQPHKYFSDIMISNGLCWSPDGNIMYHADSERHSIYQYHYCQQSHTLSQKRLFAETENHAFPDGSTVDTDGFIWNAQWGDHSVVRYNPDGEIVEKLVIPAVQPSSVAIGGPNLDWLIVTTSRITLSPQQLADYPLSGNVFIYQLHNVTGIVDTQCDLLTP
ncbi:SMP-30/gluconolactonase/LRE family protein [Shewanella basaltis]|uniref:SMP-30/gluconolactonase/LRE family protein n=1 Tax=Shewanella basaltis TaxID=472183 RepID=UPI003AAC9BB1